MKQRFATGFGYGYIPDSDNEEGFHWYSCSGGHTPYATRLEAHNECKQELSWTSKRLYTQRWVTLFGVTIKLWFTRRAVEWSNADAARGEALLINTVKNNLHDRLETLICRYDDCGMGHVIEDESPLNSQITCPNCRIDLGLDDLPY